MVQIDTTFASPKDSLLFYINSGNEEQQMSAMYEYCKAYRQTNREGVYRYGLRFNLYASSQNSGNE